MHSIDPRYPDLPYRCRQQYHAMVMVMDEMVGNITAAFKAKGMWERTLMVMSSEYVPHPSILFCSWNPIPGGSSGCCVATAGRSTSPRTPPTTGRRGAGSTDPC